MGTWDALQKKGKKPSKYGARKTEIAGRSFASASEASCFQYLQALEQAGELRDLRCQVTVYLTRAKIIYRPDFMFIDAATNRVTYAEFKGFETSDWRIKRKLWMFYGPGVLRIYKGSARRIWLHETLTPDSGVDASPPAASV